MPSGAHHGDINKVATPTRRTAPNEAAIVAEIAARLIEWRIASGVLTESKPFKWIQRISALGRDNPDALWLYLHLQSGDLSALTDTYQQQAQERSLDRQAVHQRHQRAIDDMKLHFPELRAVINDLDAHFRPPRGIINKSV